MVCKQLSTELKGLCRRRILYASVREDSAQASIKGKVQASLKDIYDKIREFDKPYVLILDDVQPLVRDIGVSQGINKNERTLLLKIIDYTVQQGSVICRMFRSAKS